MVYAIVEKEKIRKRKRSKMLWKEKTDKQKGVYMIYDALNLLQQDRLGYVKYRLNKIGFGREHLFQLNVYTKYSNKLIKTLFGGGLKAEIMKDRIENLIKELI